MSDVNLSISKEVINPIIKEKVNQIVLNALGGTEELVKNVVDSIVNQKVNIEGKISNYSSDNKYNWLDVVVTKQIKEAVKAELEEQIKNSSSEIRKALIEQIQTKKGSSLVAKALLSGLEGSFKSSWTSKLEVSISPNFKEN